MSNKFWAGGSSSSEESSDSDSDGSDAGGYQGGVRQAGRFALSDSSSDDEDRPKVVRSTTDRVWAHLREIVLRLRNALKNGDWPLVQDEFDAVNKKMDKSKAQIDQTGTPKFYIKMLAYLEDEITTVVADKEGVKKMKPVVGRAVNRMKVTIKKHNKNYEGDIEDYRANPTKYDTEVEQSSDSDSDEESDDESDGGIDEESVADKVADSGDGNSDSEDSLFKDNISESDDSDDDDDLFGYSAAAPAGGAVNTDGRRELKGRVRWLKKADTGEKKKKDKPKAAAGGAKPTKADAKAQAALQKEKVESIELVLTEEELSTRMRDIMVSRGRKGTDPRDLLRKLEVLTRAARRFGPRTEIPVLMHLISAMCDAHRVIDDFMVLHQWRTCFRSLMRVVTLLSEDHDLELIPLVGEGYAVGVAEEPEDEVKEENKNQVSVVGNLETFLMRLEDEYTKSLQQINPHTQEYVTRLSDEALLIELAESISEYYIRKEDARAASVIALLRIEHMYYKHDSVAVAVQKAAAFNRRWGKFSDIHPACTRKATNTSSRNVEHVHPAVFIGYPVVEVKQQNNTEDLNKLCQYVFKNGDERSKTRALLCSVFHHALHDRFYHARDLFLISHIQDVIDKADTKTMILYNRVLATLGLSAFREGLIQKAYDCLTNICAVKSSQVKELLAQGQVRYSDKDVEQERLERRRLIPYHMHINPDLLDCCYLVCAMLLELPQMAKNDTSQPYSYRNATFRRYFSTYQRQTFTGPPENTREHVLAAAKALLAGDWKSGTNYILKMDVWNLIPNEGGAAVKKQLYAKIKEEAVRVYLLSNGVAAYKSMKVVHLCEVFEMEAPQVRRIVSKMIFNKEFSAAWDGDDSLVLHKSDPSTLQSLSLKVAERVAGLVESNERLLDPLAGGNLYGGNDNERYNNNKYGNRQWHNRDDDRQQGPRRYTNSGASGRKDYQNNNNNKGRGKGHRGRGGYQNRDNQQREEKSAWGGAR